MNVLPPEKTCFNYYKHHDDKFKTPFYQMTECIISKNYNYNLVVSLLIIKDGEEFRKPRADDIYVLHKFLYILLCNLDRYVKRRSIAINQPYEPIRAFGCPETKTKNRSADARPHYHIELFIPDFPKEEIFKIQNFIEKQRKNLNKRFDIGLNFKIDPINTSIGSSIYTLKHFLYEDSEGDILLYQPKPL